METFVFKFSACLAVFWLVYILFLERQTMHRFKRFYLLIAIASALVIPTLTITQYVEPVPSDYEVSTIHVPIQPSLIEQPQVQTPLYDLETVLWMLYGLGVFVFAIRFIVNLYKMYKRISTHDQIEKRPFIYILLEECRIPHSFFNYLFFERSKYETDTIPDEVKLHEETHAKQLHSLDIIAIELLQIVFWFHPLIYILKHHIKLNHEFLADQAVLDDGIDTKAYQKVLLQFSSPDGYRDNEYQLSSTINYSSIKKRFTVMKTHTSKTRMWLSSLLLLPIIAILFYSFAEARYVERAPIEKSELLEKEFNTQAEEADVTTYRQLTEQYLTALNAYKKGAQFDYSELKVLYTKTYQLYKSFSKSEIDTYNILPPPPLPMEKTPVSILNILIDEDSNLLVNNEPSNFESLESVLKNLNVPENYAIALKFENQSSPEMKEKTLLLIKKYDLLHVVNSSKTGDQQKKATPKEIADYNTWAKKIHKTLAEAEANNTKEYPIIKLKDLNRYKGIYSKMTTVQKENSQVWPKLPPMPIPPPAPAPPARKKNKTIKTQLNNSVEGINFKYEKSGSVEINGATYYYSQKNGETTYYDQYGNTVDINKIPPPPPTPAPIAPPAPKSKDKTGPSQTKNTIQPVEITIKKDKSLELNGKLVSLENFVDDVKKLNQHLTLEQRREHVFASILVESNDHMSFAKDIQQQLKKADIYNCIVGYNETKRKAGLPIKHFNLNAGLTIEEARKEREKMLEADNNGESLDELIDSLNKKDNNKWSYTVETSFVETSDETEVEMDNLPPPQPVPEATIDFIVKMAKANAKFFSEGKPISSDKAISLIKSNPKLNIHAQKTDTEQPFIYLFEKAKLIGEKWRTKD